MIIRPATLDDVDAMAAVLVASWQAAYAGLLPADFLAELDPAARAQQWRQTLSSQPEAGVVVAEIADRVVGMAAVGADQEDPSVGILYAIYVHPDHWGAGAGHELHQAGLQILRERGCKNVRLWVLRSNELAIRFYRRHDWTHDGREQIDRYFAGIELNEIGLSRSL